jgi:hypothetical protein
MDQMDRLLPMAGLEGACVRHNWNIEVGSGLALTQNSDCANHGGWVEPAEIVEYSCLVKNEWEVPLQA